MPDYCNSLIIQKSIVNNVNDNSNVKVMIQNILRGAQYGQGIQKVSHKRLQTHLGDHDILKD